MIVVWVADPIPVTGIFIVGLNVGAMYRRSLVGKGVTDAVGEGKNNEGEVGVAVGVLVELGRVGLFSWVRVGVTVDFPRP